MHLIAQDSEPTYWAMLAIPRFARSITIGKRFDYMEWFGHNWNIHCRRNCWTRRGLPHKIGGPALITRIGRYYEEWWYKNGKLHRMDGPAYVVIDRITGVTKEERWYCCGYLHRIGAPAVQISNGDYEWRERGQLHCLSGPAMRITDYDCGFIHEYWYIYKTEWTEWDYTLFTAGLC